MGRIWGQVAGSVQGRGLRTGRTWAGSASCLAFCLGSLMEFLLGYFGWSSDRTEHELIPSLLRALLGGVFWGLVMTTYLEWADRRARRE